ncbi:hypothetical protein [Georgenia sp. AZ-5]|uniref:hypothetical protein n=1 Tax=Georgenia sp. AZ-5 TaxID=3367526 RepID=UPI003754BCE3
MIPPAGIMVRDIHRTGRHSREQQWRAFGDAAQAVRDAATGAAPGTAFGRAARGPRPAPAADAVGGRREERLGAGAR